MRNRWTLGSLVGLGLLYTAACGPAPGSAGPAAALPIEQAPAATSAQAEPTQPPEPASALDAGAPTGAGEGVAGPQPLDLGANDENCIIPGMVISGQNPQIAPCEPAFATETGVESQEETDAMPQRTTPQEPQEPQPQNAEATGTASLAVADLAQRLGIPAEEIAVRDLRAVTWPDASIGCPEPDMMYAQVEQDGLLIRLSAGGESYFYHSGADQMPFLCEETLQLTPPDLKKPDEFVPPPGYDIDKPD